MSTDAVPRTSRFEVREMLESDYGRLKLVKVIEIAPSVFLSFAKTRDGVVVSLDNDGGGSSVELTPQAFKQLAHKLRAVLKNFERFNGT